MIPHSGTPDRRGHYGRAFPHAPESRIMATMVHPDSWFIVVNPASGGGRARRQAPRLCAEFQAATLSGDYAKALQYQDRLMPLHEAIFIEPGLAGAKYGLSKLNLCSPDVRLPLVGLTDGTKARIDAAMRHAGLIN